MAFSEARKNVHGLHPRQRGNGLCTCCVHSAQSMAGDGHFQNFISIIARPCLGADQGGSIS